MRPIFSPVGPNPLVKWLARRREAEYQEQRLVEIALETNMNVPDLRADPFAAPNDPFRLRGIPAIGGRGSVGGAIRGSRPGDGLT